MGLYCDFLAQHELSTTNMLGAIPKQLVSRGGIPGHTREAFRAAGEELGGRGLRSPDIVEILKKTISTLRPVSIYINALDESTEKHRRELLQSPREIV